MASVRATCPKCQNSLKFPASWAGKAMKCKNCGAVVKANVPNANSQDDTAAAPAVLAVPAMAAVPVIEPIADSAPVIVPTAYVPPADFTAGFAEPVSNPQATGRYRKPSGNVGKIGVLVVLGMIAATLGISGFIYVKKQRESDDSQKVVKNTPATVKSTLSTTSVVFPRRLLFVNISKYAFMNPLFSGQGPRGDMASETARKLAFEWRVPQDNSNNQFYLLSDSMGKSDTPPVMKAVLEPTIYQFIESSRKQDRIAIYFGGHALEKDGKAYLAASDGDPDDPTSLIALDSIYTKLKDCPAQQKIVIWDVCRLNPQFGRAFPGSEPMTEKLHQLLTSPPPGIQAWVSCSIGENAIELPRTGSEFLESFHITSLKGIGPKSGSAPEDPIPITEWAALTQTKLNQLVTKNGKPSQTTKLVGLPGESVQLNHEEPAPVRFEFPKPPKGADPVALAAAFALIDLPGLRSDKNSSTPLQSFTVPEAALKDYLADSMTADEAMKLKDKHPIRAAAASSLIKIRKAWKGASAEAGLRETFVGEASDRVKKAILAEQETPARIILELDAIIEDCEKLEKDLDKEPSKRWRATFQYALAQAKARWVYMNEYNLMLGMINKNELPTIDEKKGQTGWQMISMDQMKSKKDIKDKAEAAKELFDKIATEHKGTPWAVMAKQYKNVKLGLDWRVVTPGEDKVD